MKKADVYICPDLMPCQVEVTEGQYNKGYSDVDKRVVKVMGHCL